MRFAHRKKGRRMRLFSLCLYGFNIYVIMNNVLGVERL